MDMSTASAGPLVDVPSELLDVMAPIRRTLRRAIRRDLPDEVLPPAQVELLGLIDRARGVRVSDAAAALQLAPNTVSTLVHQLTRAGLARRERDPDDRRSVRLWPTPEAERVLSVRREFRRQAVAGALDRMSLGDRRRIEAALPALRRLLQHLDDAGHLECSIPTEDCV
jgi:DNA-binding MarR family transcriptional regulator